MSRPLRPRKPLERIQTPPAPRRAKRTRFAGAADTENADGADSTPKCSVCSVKDAAQGKLCVDCFATEAYVELSDFPVVAAAPSTSTLRLATLVEETAVERLQRENAKLNAENNSLQEQNIRLKSELDVAQKEIIESKDRNSRVSLLYDCVYADSLRMEAKIKELVEKLGTKEGPDTAGEAKSAAAQPTDSSPEKEALTRRDTLTDFYLSDGN